jgi:hypothetical protein
MTMNHAASATPQNDATPKAKTETKSRGRAGKFASDAKIKLLVKENPKKAGSKARTRFALYKDGMTVGQFLSAGGLRIDLEWDAKHAFIAIK